MAKKTHEITEPTHLLLELAKSYPVADQDLSPKDCHYSISEGAWMLQGVDSLLVDTPGRPRPATKKFDIETGEDQKGA